MCVSIDFFSGNLDLGLFLCLLVYSQLSEENVYLLKRSGKEKKKFFKECQRLNKQANTVGQKSDFKNADYWRVFFFYLGKRKKA